MKKATVFFKKHKIVIYLIIAIASPLILLILGQKEASQVIAGAEFLIIILAFLFLKLELLKK